MPAPARAERAQGGTSPLGIDHHLEDYGRMDQGPQVEETYMARRGFDTESHDPPGSAEGKDSERPYTA